MTALPDISAAAALTETLADAAAGLHISLREACKTIKTLSVALVERDREIARLTERTRVLEEEVAINKSP